MANRVEKYIKFEQVGFTKKTKVWEVINMRSGFVCGKISWWGAFRAYCFFPVPDSLFDADCMRLIADFCQENRTARNF